MNITEVKVLLKYAKSNYLDWQKRQEAITRLQEDNSNLEEVILKLMLPSIGEEKEDFSIQKLVSYYQGEISLDDLIKELREVID